MAAENTRPPRTDKERPAAHWAVAMNYRIRTVAWLAMFILIGLHLHDHGHGPLAWMLLVLQFLVYPHVAYWRGRRSSKPLQAEIQTLLLDNLLFGIWTAALGFPIWIGFPPCISGAMNMAAFRGVRGMLQALGAIGVGMLITVGLGGWHFAPQTSWPVTVLGMLTLAGYLLMFSLSAYKRTLQLHETRMKLRRSEQALQQRLLEIDALQSQLSDQANRDPLTGLYNRRYLAATMARELERCRRDAAPLSLLLIDIDHFKQINDLHGHPAGDRVLKEVARLLNQHARGGDVVCRYGGEEFVLLLPHMPVEVALERAEQCRRSLQAAALPWQGSTIRTTLSAGVACYPQHGATVEALIQAADTALYRAKTGGRNQVQTAPAAGSTPVPVA